MRLASLSLLLAALPAITSAAAFADAHGPRGPARTERDADLTSWRGQDRIGEYTITAYAGDVVEFVRDALAPLGQVEGDDGLGKMTNAERLKRKLKIAKPAKMRRSGGDAPTRARPALAKRSSTWKRTCPVFAAGKSAWQHCHGGHSCSTSQAYECAIVDSFQDCQAGCGWGCASATYQQDTGYCFFYYDCCSDGLVQQYQ